MQTPYGRECPFYTVNAHRRSQAVERCHLLEGTPDAKRWTSEYCATCPVPDIKRANQCENMVLHAHIGRPRWRFWERPRMMIRATCTRSGGAVEDPMVGCGQCHAPLEFVVYKDTDQV